MSGRIGCLVVCVVALVGCGRAEKLQNEQLRAQVQVLEKAREALEAAAIQQKDEAGKLSERFQAGQAELTRSTKQVDDMRQQLDAVKAQLGDREGQITKLNADLQQALATNKSLQEQVATLKAQLEKAQPKTTE